MSPVERLTHEADWLGKNLPGNDNALWRCGRTLWQQRNFVELHTHLTDWGRHLQPLGQWDRFGDEQDRGQARSLTEGTRCLFLALAYLGLGRLEPFLTTLTDAARAYQDACSGTPVPARATPAHVPAAADLHDTVQAALQTLEAAGNDIAEGVAMLRSGLDSLFPGLLPPPLHEVHLPVLFFRGLGISRCLTLQAFPASAGRACLFPDPVRLGTTVLDREFRQALDCAWRYALPHFTTPCQVRWCVTPLYSSDRWLTGASAGAAFAANLLGLARRLVFDRVGLTATVTAEGRLGPVQGIDHKVHSGRQDSIRRFVLCRGDASAHSYLRPLADVELAEAATVEEALPHLTGLMEDLLGSGSRPGAPGPLRPWGYLTALEETLDQQPWSAPAWGIHFFDGLHIQVRVAPHHRDPEADREGERQRHAGRPSALDLREAGADSYAHPADEARFAGSSPLPLLPWHHPTLPSARHQYPSALLLGDPGMGKTTLLRYEAWLCAREQAAALRQGQRSVADVVLPVYVRLADLADRVAQPDMIDTLARLATDPRQGVAVSPRLGELLRHKLQAGEVVLLFDALDEVPAEDYERVVRWLQGWVRAYPPQRLYLTSRLAGYRGTPLPPSAGTGAALVELELVAFTPGEVQRFVRSRLRSGPQVAEALWTQLRSEPALLGLAQTPLLLTLMCLAAANAGSGRKLVLPATRAALYAECLEGLLRRWPCARLASCDPAPSARVHWRLRQQRRLLAELAWGLAARDPERTLFSVEEIIRVLETPVCTALRAELGWTIEQALTEWTEGQGILTRAGAGVETRYLFLHRTFQEYLLAWALALRDDWLTAALARLYFPAWAEVLALLGGVLEQQDREMGAAAETRRLEVYLERLLQVNREDVLCRPLLLAARVAGEAYGPLPAWVSRLTDLLGELYLQPPSFLSRPDLLPALAALHTLPSRPLLEALRSGQPVSQVAAAEALREAGGRCPEVLRALCDAASARPWEVRRAVMAALGVVGAGSAEALTILKGAAGAAGEDERVRLAAVRALGNLADGQSEALAALSDCLKHPNRRVGLQVIEELQELALHNPEAVSILNHTCTQHADRHVSRAAARALLALSPRTPAADLSVRLRDPDPAVRREAVRELRTLGPGHPGVEASLIEATQDADERTCRLAIEVLALLGVARDEVLAALLRQKDHPSGQVRRAVVEALATLGRDPAGGRAEVLATLLQALEDESAEVCRAAVEGLEVLADGGKSLEEVVARLQDLCRHTSPGVRRAAVGTLARLGAGQPAGLLPILRDALRDEDEHVRRAAVEGLGSLATDQAEVVQELWHVVLEDAEVRFWAKVALRRLANQRQRPVSGEALEEACATIRTAHVQLQDRLTAILAGQSP